MRVRVCVCVCVYRLYTGRLNYSDPTPPVITLTGSPVVRVAQFSTYTDLGATAVDDLDFDIPTFKLVVSLRPPGPDWRTDASEYMHTHTHTHARTHTHTHTLVSCHLKPLSLQMNIKTCLAWHMELVP